MAVQFVDYRSYSTGSYFLYRTRRPPPIPDEFEEASAVDILLPDRKALNYLVTNGFDLDHNVAQTEDGIKVTIIATPSELNFLEFLAFLNLEPRSVRKTGKNC